MKFIETRETACRGNYPINVLLAVDNISTVLECEDDYKYCLERMLWKEIKKMSKTSNQ